MLEIGCNVVVLSLDEYEKLKKQVRAAERSSKQLYEAVKFRKSYWDNDAPRLNIDLRILEDEIKAAWENYNEDNKEQFVMRPWFEDSDCNVELFNNFFDKAPTPEEEGEELV